MEILEKESDSFERLVGSRNVDDNSIKTILSKLENEITEQRKLLSILENGVREHFPQGLTNRTANIALVCYTDGERRYIIAPKGLTVGARISSGRNAQIKVGDTLPLRNIPMGTIIHCVELLPGKGAQLARSAGTSGDAANRRVSDGSAADSHLPD